MLAFFLRGLGCVPVRGHHIKPFFAGMWWSSTVVPWCWEDCWPRLALVSFSMAACHGVCLCGSLLQRFVDGNTGL